MIYGPEIPSSLVAGPVQSEGFYSHHYRSSSLVGRDAASHYPDCIEREREG